MRVTRTNCSAGIPLVSNAGCGFTPINGLILTDRAYARRLRPLGCGLERFTVATAFHPSIDARSVLRQQSMEGEVSGTIEAGGDPAGAGAD